MRQLFSRTPTAAHRLFGVLLVAALVSAACGDDAGSDSDLTGSDDASDGLASDDTESDDNSTDGETSDPATSDPATSDPDQSGGDDGQSTDALIEDYCDLSAQVEALSVSFAGPTASAAEVEAFIREQLRLSRLSVDAAPDTMRDAMATQVEFLEEAVVLLEAAGWDLAAANNDLTELGSTPDRLEALDRLDVFDREECDIRFGGTDTTEPIDVVPPTDAPPFSDDPYCTLAAELVERPGLPFDGTPAEVEAYYDGLLADVNAAFTLAPDSLQDAYQTINDTFWEVYRILDGYDFDLDAAGTDLDAFSADPAVDEPMNAAVDMVESYDAEACGLT